MKLCTVPESTKLVFDASGAKFKYPVVRVRNVFVLPGIPQLFERVIPSLVNSWAENQRNRDLIEDSGSEKLYLCMAYIRKCTVLKRLVAIVSKDIKRCLQAI